MYFLGLYTVVVDTVILLFSNENGPLYK